jgi:hypothetical protein
MEGGLTRARLFLGLGAAAVALGIAAAGTDHRSLGGAVLVTGWLALIYGIHSFGRTGPEER